MAIAENLQKVSANIKCRRKNATYKFTQFVEYQITVDLEEDNTGSFKFSIGNVRGKYSGFITMFDTIVIYVGSTKLMTGIIDKVQYKFDNSDCIIVIEGRDISWKLTDNSATPVKKGEKTKSDVKSYIKTKLKARGITGGITKSSIPKYKGLSVGCNESELNVFQNLLADTKFRCWTLKDVFYVGEWNTSGKAVATLNQISIESATVTLDGKEVVTQITCYEQTKKGGYKKKEKITNKYAENIVKKQITHKKYSEGSSSSLKNSGLKKMKEAYLSSLEIELKIKPTTTIILPNSCVNVVIPRLGINTKMFVKRVEYFKDFDTGTEINLTLIPSDVSYTTMYKILDVTGASKS